MEHPTEFDLQLAINNFIREIDRRQVFDRDQLDELYDHFTEETASLTALGLNEREAFTVSKLRFGEAAVIRREYERVQPVDGAGQKIIFGFMGFFMIGFGYSLVSAAHQLVTSLYRRFGETREMLFLFLDYFLSFLIMGGLLTYIVYRLRTKPYFTRLELFAIPLLGFFMNFSGNRFLLQLAVLLTYILIYRERKTLIPA
ncbi:hypothetical protein [Flavilitoribacter nigricans]|uniref:Uncharacterized protein n=1 Tax=Flavilitoribacter nigricans (strain ATCC 23147 / DSM 23189 / NBRC 102662 / NCIMB 1420 / SS-2) TaxID=1122177 RepID=A0A2D0NBS4_FLAN2|nr:hypothetical protein [Flavilitoribacter nigricans]PHN05937.1 hypothetical protein CRP01_13235 [Flavilitoribacter nigricans DSM 23189 = NBRC 102662]